MFSRLSIAIAILDNIKRLFKRKPKVVELKTPITSSSLPSEATEEKAAVKPKTKPKKKRRGKGLKNVKNLKRQGLKRVPAVPKNNVDCQYVYTDW